MVVECQVCNSTDFQIQEGLHYCTNCLTQSQQHGFETVVDEEAAWAQPSRTGTRKTIGKKKKKKGIYSSFTSLDAFTFIIRGWTEEAELLGIAGPSCKSLIHRLLVLYIQKTGRAFMKNRERPSLGVRPTLRDVQVSLTGRSQLHFKRRPRGKAKAAKEDIESDSDDYVSAKRKRSRKRTAFLQSFISNDGDTDMESSTSIASSATNKGLDPLEEEDELIYATRNKTYIHVWNQLKANAQPLPASYGSDVYYITLTKLLALFSIALLTQDSSQVTLGDIVHLANAGSISVMTAGVHLPPSMVMQGSDWRIFSLVDVDNLYEKLRNNMTALIQFLGLKDINFGSPLRYKRVCRGLIKSYGINKIPLLERYIREFSLPQALIKPIQIAFKHTKYLDELIHKDGICPDVSLRVFAVILIVLKYLYGLDDFTEDFISSTMLETNKTLPPEKKRFVIRDWIRLSRFRIFCLMRHSHIFHQKFLHLMPKTRMTHSTYISKVREHAYKIKILNRGGSTCKGSGDKKLESLEKFLFQVYGEELPPSCSVYFGETLSPMNKFSKDIIDDTYSGHDDLMSLPQETKDKIKELMEMNSLQLGMTKASESRDSIELDLPIIESMNMRTMLDTTSSHFQSTDLKKLDRMGKSYSFRKRYYWQAHLSPRLRFKSNLDAHFEKLDKCCISQLPNSYLWILKYFSSYIGAPPSCLHAEVIHLEMEITRNTKSHFGKHSMEWKLQAPTQVTDEKIANVIDEIIDKYVNEEQEKTG